MNLPQIREKQDIKQKQIVEEVKRKADPRFTMPILSYAEHGIVLVTPEVLKAICEYTGVSPEDIYTAAEVDLLGCMGRSEPLRVKKKDGHRIRRKATFRLTEWAYKSLEMHRLRALGYPTKSAWFYDMIRRTNRQYVETLKRRRRHDRKEAAAQ